MSTYLALIADAARPGAMEAATTDAEHAIEEDRAGGLERAAKACCGRAGEGRHRALPGDGPPGAGIAADRRRAGHGRVGRCGRLAWDRDASPRSEFRGDLSTFVAFQRAAEAGRVKVYSGQAVQKFTAADFKK